MIEMIEMMNRSIEREGRAGQGVSGRHAMRRTLALALVACIAACGGSNDDGDKKRDKKEDKEDKTEDKKQDKKRRDRDDDDDRDSKKKGGKERDEDLEDDVLTGLERYRDDACECKDAACAEKVNSDFRDWRRKMKRKMRDADKPPERLIKRLTETQKELEACVRKHKLGGACDQLKARVCDGAPDCTKAFDDDMKGPASGKMSDDEINAACKMVLDAPETVEMMKKSMKRKADRAGSSTP